MTKHFSLETVLAGLAPIAVTPERLLLGRYVMDEDGSLLDAHDMIGPYLEDVRLERVRAPFSHENPMTVPYTVPRDGDVKAHIQAAEPETLNASLEKINALDIPRAIAVGPQRQPSIEIKSIQLRPFTGDVPIRLRNNNRTRALLFGTIANDQALHLGTERTVARRPLGLPRADASPKIREVFLGRVEGSRNDIHNEKYRSWVTNQMSPLVGSWFLSAAGVHNLTQLSKQSDQKLV